MIRNINKIKTKYIYLYKSKNFIFYRCNKRKNCNGKTKVNIPKKILQITEYTKDNDNHEKIEYNKFCELYKKNKIIWLILKTNTSKNIIFNIIVKNKEIDNASIIKQFFDTTKEKFILSKSEISKIWSKIIGEYKNLSLEQVINKIKEAIPDLLIKIHDIIYEKKIKNKIERRNQRLIYFGASKNIELIKPEFTDEYFLDVNYQIISSQFMPYKLLVLSGILKII